MARTIFERRRYEKEYYQKNRERLRKRQSFYYHSNLEYRKKAIERAIRSRRRCWENFKIKRLELISKLGGKCEKCGFDNPIALQFHHKLMDGRAKKRSQMYEKAFLADIEKNILDIQLLCANCHIILHGELKNG